MRPTWEPRQRWIRRRGCCSARNCAANCKMEEQPVHLYAFRGHINVFTQAVYEEDKRAATADPVADQDKLEQAGMK